MDMQECSQEAKEFSGNATLFSALALMWMDVFFILSLTEKIISIHVKVSQSRYNAVFLYKAGSMELLCPPKKHDGENMYPVNVFVLVISDTSAAPNTTLRNVSKIKTD